MANRARARAGRRERGQATVELAILLPLLAFGLLAIVQIALVVRDQLAVVHAARQAARVAAVDPDPAHAVAAGRRVAGDAWVVVGPRPEIGGEITVEVAMRSRTDLPLVGPLVPDPVVHSRAVMRVER